jgi:hypothetical protein
MGTTGGYQMYASNKNPFTLYKRKSKKEKLSIMSGLICLTNPDLPVSLPGKLLIKKPRYGLIIYFRLEKSFLSII